MLPGRCGWCSAAARRGKDHPPLGLVLQLTAQFEPVGLPSQHGLNIFGPWGSVKNSIVAGIRVSAWHSVKACGHPACPRVAEVVAPKANCGITLLRLVLFASSCFLHSCGQGCEEMRASAEEEATS